MQVERLAKYNLKEIPSGVAGIRETLKYMSRLTNSYKKSPVIRELALAIVKDIPPKKWQREVNAIFRYVRDTIRYTKDIRGCETLQTPVQTLKIKQGDCDDQSMLAAALLETIGHPTRFVAVGFTPNSFSHVFVQTKIGNKWITLECTMEKWRLGQTPRNIKNKIIQDNYNVR